MNKTLNGTLRIGTSGVALPGTKESFPEEFQTGTRLRYYSSLFKTIEINSSFYKLPKPSTFEKWAGEVHADFKFTIKLWKEITHIKKLLFQQDNIDLFMKAVNKIGDKKGCLLVQFPASINVEYKKQVESILNRLNQLNDDHSWKLSIELRHASWYEPSLYELLYKHNSSLVFHDIAASKTPIVDTATDVIYYRFHGPNGDYRGSYTKEFLAKYSIEIKNWLNYGKEVFVYFNNTMGNAFENATFLDGLIKN